MTLTILNILVVIILTYAYVPQLRTTFSTKSVDGVSVMFWYFISVSTAISLYNLLLSGSGEWYIYLGQIINASIALILFIWINLKKLTLEQTMLITAGHILTLFIALEIFPLAMTQLLATFAILSAYLDQIKHFYKTKKADGTNPKLYFYFALGLTLLVIIMFLTHVSVHVIITELINIALLLICGIYSHKLLKTNKI